MRGPISINGNADLQAQASAEGWPGDGSADRPYIIAGYNIDASGGAGISIRNVNMFVRVVDNRITDPVDGQPYNGINIQNAGAVVVASNRIDVEGKGITVRGAGGAPFDYVAFALVSAGLQEETQANAVRGNTIRDASTGIHLLGGAFNWPVTQNVLHGVGDGIRVERGSESPVTGNTIKHCSGTALYVLGDEGGRTDVITDNSVEHCAHGLVAERSHTIARNTFVDIDFTAMLLYDPIGAITDNVIERAQVGIRSVLDPPVEVSRNRISETTSHGIRMDDYTLVRDNAVEGAGGHGIVVGGNFRSSLPGSESGIIGNVVKDVARRGIQAGSGSIVNNHVEGAEGDGVVVFGSTSASGNSVLEAGGHGMILGDPSVVDGNLVRDSVGDGIIIDEMFGSSISFNAIAGNGGDGLRVGSWGNNDLVPDIDSVLAGPRAEGNVVRGNGGTGIHLGFWGPSSSTTAFESPVQVKDNTVEANAVGIALDDPPAMEFTRNRIAGNGLGLNLSSDHSSFVLVAPADYLQKVWDNWFDNGVNAVATVGAPVQWYTTPLPGSGPNVAGGATVGGNFWSDYAGTDADGDGFGDSPHQPTADPARLDQYPVV